MSNHAQELSAAELYAINFQNPEPKYYTRIPNILSQLTYDYMNPKTGEIEVKRLSVYAKEFYRELKDVTGSSGKCWRNRDDLAERCNMSSGMITKCKEELTQKFHQLDGNPLIVVSEKKKKVRHETNVTGAEYHEIMIVDIWKWNNAFMSISKFVKKEACPSPHDGVDPCPSPHDELRTVSPSCSDTNKNPINKNPSFKKKQPVSDDTSVVSSLDQDSVFSSVSSQIQQAYQWLTGQGCPEKNAASIVKKFSSKDISEASKYSEIQFAKNKSKGKPTENKWAYFQNVLNQRYWEKKNV